jgi:hypothetical protein
LVVLVSPLLLKMRRHLNDFVGTSHKYLGDIMILKLV